LTLEASRIRSATARAWHSQAAQDRPKAKSGGVHKRAAALTAFAPGKCVLDASRSLELLAKEDETSQICRKFAEAYSMRNSAREAFARRIQVFRSIEAFGTCSK
jgi:hypothetical protein